MADDDVFVLGAANLKQRTRTNKSGVSKSRYTVQVSGDSLLINTDPKSLGKGPAEAIAALYRERISSISAVASEATLRARAVAAKAFAAGEAWAVKRYGGGRLGPMAPNQSNRAFNDSGRLAKGIAVGAVKDGYVINFAANRWQASDVKDGEAGIKRIFAMLSAHVPELADASKLMDSIPVRRAIKAGNDEMIQKADERTLELKRQRMQAAIQVVRAALSLVG
jgi:hypothetical protein